MLADCLDREAGEDPATEYQRKSLARADHLGLLHARWADQVKTADHERYLRIVQHALPEEWRGQLSPQATWLYRTMKAAKLEARQNVMVPDEDPDCGYLGQAWPWQERDSDEILQPPKPELRPCAGIERLAGREIPDLEAGA